MRSAAFNTRAGSGAKEGEGDVVDLAVGGDAVRPLQVRPAVPVGEPPAGLLDNHLEPGDVPDADPAIDHQVAGALRDEHEAVIVAEPAGPVDAAEDVSELPLLTRLLK